MPMFKFSARLVLASLFILNTPHAWSAESKADLVRNDFAEERVVDLSVVKKVTGKKKIAFITVPKYTEFLEGFIRGMVVDYSDNPVEGVLVRVGDPGEENSMFDPTVTNFNGIYRIRFSIPFDAKGHVDVRNKLVYAPDWEQKRDSLGNSYEPLEKESPFHMYYDRSSVVLSICRGSHRKARQALLLNPVQAMMNIPHRVGMNPEAKKTVKRAADKKDAGGDDFFKAFGGGF